MRRFLTISALQSLFWPALPSYPPFFLLTVAPFALSALFLLLRRLFERFLAHLSVSEVSADSAGFFGSFWVHSGCSGACTAPHEEQQQQQLLLQPRRVGIGSSSCSSMRGVIPIFVASRSSALRGARC